MINLLLEELKEITKSRKVKDYKRKSKDELIKPLSELRPKIIFSKVKIEEINKKFNGLRDRFSKLKIKDIRTNFSEIGNEKNLFIPKIKGIKKIFLN